VAQCGDLLLDAAQTSGVDIPFDCRSGYCGTCRVRVLKGRCFGGEGRDPGYVHACQSRVISDLDLVLEETPDIVACSGRLVRLTPLAPDVVEVTIALDEPAQHLPGQYYKVAFRGFPARCYSATVPFAGRRDLRVLRFHVRIVPHGRVSSELRARIGIGHRAKLEGPLGSAYLRPGLDDRLILVAGGTGFAPIWAIADAAMRENSQRDLVLVIGARKLASLYMIPALSRLARCRNVVIIPVVAEPQDVSRAVRQGQPIDHLPALSPHDIVYAAGAPAMVEAVVDAAHAAGATCFADPFEAAPADGDDITLGSRIAQWFARAEAPSVQPSLPQRPLPDPDRDEPPARPPPRHRPAWLDQMQ
jgi:3-phenylpropionate/trans-cinnamate dioxygenase ferredoxin reductase subunit